MAKDNGGSMIPGFSLSVGGEALTRLLKLERKPLPKVELVMTDADNATLYVDGIRAFTGPLCEATKKIGEVGLRAGDTYEMLHPNGTRLIVLWRTLEERANGVSAIVRRLSKQEVENDS